MQIFNKTVPDFYDKSDSLSLSLMVSSFENHQYRLKEKNVSSTRL